MKRFNFDEFLWFIVLILINLSVIYLIYTGRADFYIGKKMIKYLYIAILMIVVITVFQVSNVFTSKNNNRIKQKLLPIILTLIIGAISINKQETFKHIELNKVIKESNTSTIDRKSLYNHEYDYSSIENNVNLNNESISNISTRKNSDDKLDLTEDKKQEILVVNEDNPTVLDDIRMNPQKYIGRNLEIHGFVCKESYLSGDQFIIGRIIMKCCAADAKIVGIIGEYDKIYDLDENEKISVRGRISSSNIKDDNDISHIVPVIIIEDLKRE